MQQVSRGRELSYGIIAHLGPHAAAVASRLGRKPALAIVAGADEQSRRFVQIKQRLLGGMEIEIRPVWLEADADTAQTLEIIERLNPRNDLEAIFLQFPLPEAIDASRVSNAIEADKDIDCSSAVAEARFMEGTTEFVPVAPQAACMLLRETLGELPGRAIVVYGDDDPFVRGLRILLRRESAHVDGTIGDAEALVVSEPLPPADMLSNASALSVVLDAGYYLPPRTTEWLPPGIADRTGVLLKQYGNVGPLTVANLARATVRAASRRVNLET
jgi:methylenetetrahydrofolate dehydrogenase (NADP+) / methenyltetrahydrofolate cyclohydrolase